MAKRNQRQKKQKSNRGRTVNSWMCLTGLWGRPCNTQ